MKLNLGSNFDIVQYSSRYLLQFRNSNNCNTKRPQVLLIITDHVPSTRKGNVFIGVCHMFRGRGGPAWTSPPAPPPTMSRLTLPYGHAWSASIEWKIQGTVTGIASKRWWEDVLFWNALRASVRSRYQWTTKCSYSTTKSYANSLLLRLIIKGQVLATLVQHENNYQI